MFPIHEIKVKVTKTARNLETIRSIVEIGGTKNIAGVTAWSLMVLGGMDQPHKIYHLRTIGHCTKFGSCCCAVISSKCRPGEGHQRERYSTTPWDIPSLKIHAEHRPCSRVSYLTVYKISHSRRPIQIAYIFLILRDCHLLTYLLTYLLTPALFTPATWCHVFHSRVFSRPRVAPHVVIKIFNFCNKFFRVSDLQRVKIPVFSLTLLVCDKLRYSRKRHLYVQCESKKIPLPLRFYGIFPQTVGNF